MSAPGEPTTIRAHLEAIQRGLVVVMAWAGDESDWEGSVRLRQCRVGAERAQAAAVAALAILDNASYESFCDEHGKFHTVPYCRLVPDPVRLVGRVEPHDDNGDTT